MSCRSRTIRRICTELMNMNNAFAQMGIQRGLELAFRLYSIIEELLATAMLRRASISSISHWIPMSPNPAMPTGSAHHGLAWLVPLTSPRQLPMRAPVERPRHLVIECARSSMQGARKCVHGPAKDGNLVSLNPVSILACRGTSAVVYTRVRDSFHFAKRIIVLSYK